MRQILVPLLAIIAFCLWAAPTQANTITFNSSNGVGVFHDGFRDSATIEGYNFMLTSVSLGGFEVTTQGNLNHNGTPELFVSNHSVITMKENSGRLFNLSMFDLAGSWTDPADFNRWASSIEITGFFGGGGSITANIALPTTAVMQTHILSGFIGLNSVVYSPETNASFPGPNNYEFNLDNIVVDTVPEPRTLLLLGVSLAGIALNCYGRARNRREFEQN